MSWAKQNKFLAGYCTVVGAAVVLAGALLFFAYSKWSEAAEGRDQSDKDLTNLEGARPFPSPQNLEDAKARAAEDEAASKELLDKVSEKYRFPLPTAINAGTWAQDLNSRLEGIKNSASVNEVKLFEGFNLGMSDYAGGKQPAEKNLPELAFQVAALDALVSQLIGTGITELKFMDREKLEGEPGYVEPKSSNSRNRAPVRKNEGPFKRYPVEVLFETSSKGRGLDVFLRNIASHPKFFYTIRLLRIENERQLRPSHADSIKAEYQSLEEKKMIEESSKTDNPVFPKVRIQGREKLTVYAIIDIIRFNDEGEKKAGSPPQG